MPATVSRFLAGWSAMLSASNAGVMGTYVTVRAVFQIDCGSVSMPGRSGMSDEGRPAYRQIVIWSR